MGMKTSVIIIGLIYGAVSSGRGQTANDDFYLAPANAPLLMSAPGVLANDSGGGSLTAVLVTGPTNGNLTFNVDGSFTYAPATNFSGVDGFTYQATDGVQTSSVATASITVLAPGELFYDNFSRPADTGSLSPWVPYIGNDELSDWGITNGALTSDGFEQHYGYIYYDRPDWTDYSVQAQIRFSSSKAASAGLMGRLDPASGAHYSVWVYPEHSSETNLVPGNGTAVLWLIKYEDWIDWSLMGKRAHVSGLGTNWHALTLTFQSNSVSAYFGGKLAAQITDDGSIDGQPPFTNGGMGVVMWTQPSRPYQFSVRNVIVTTSNVVANFDTYTVKTNGTLHVAAPGVLANDSGIGSLRAVLVAKPTNGKVSLSKNGGFTYKPLKNFIGTDGFTYQVIDSQSTSSVASASITVK